MLKSCSRIFKPNSRNPVSLFTNLQCKPFVNHISTHCWRTHTCGELRRRDIGKQVTLCGWAEFCRGKKFVLLRDWQGQIQMLLKKGNAQDIPVESVIKVFGIVRPRPEKDINSKQDTGDIEVHVNDVEILNVCKNLPFSLQEFAGKGEEIRMRYRYLDIRSNSMQHRLRVRSALISSMREFLLRNHGFVEVETPTLFRPTPGGAKEFLVPSSVDHGSFYSLPQSPQQFKQLLMVGGIDRYFQVARCYRDEGAKPDRQPEFTQLDIEMSFISTEDIIQITENMIKQCWPHDLSDAAFPRITYNEAMEKYGTDKPDLRINLCIKDISDHVSSSNTVNFIAVPGEYSQSLSKDMICKACTKLFDELGDTCSPNGLYTFENGKLEIVAGDKMENGNYLAHELVEEEGSLLWLSWGEKGGVKSTLAKAMHIMVEAIEKTGKCVKDDGFKFLWVYDFPLFEMDEKNKLNCVHHPFTAPHPDDYEFLKSDPTKVRSLAYDLVLNGSEVGGGSIRIHHSALQQTILKDFLNIDTKNLKHLIEALDSGAPPHGGIALGLDRLLSMLCQTDSIRDVIAFPKSSSGRDLMCGAPCKPDKETLSHFFKSTNIKAE